MACKNVDVENNVEAWHSATAKRIGAAIARRRKHLGMTAQQLAERCADLGVPIHRTTITKIENGRPRFDLGELIVIAEALDVAPVALIYPHLPDGEVERLPGDYGTSAAAVWWFTGEHDDANEPPPGDLNRLLKLTRDRYKKMAQMETADHLLGVMLEEAREAGRDLSRQHLAFLNGLIEETNEIERQISYIPGSKHSMRGHDAVPIESDDDV